MNIQSVSYRYYNPINTSDGCVSTPHSSALCTQVGGKRVFLPDLSAAAPIKKFAPVPPLKYSAQNNNTKLRDDIISFSSKKYNSNSITNPTNHCGYCGCKVYTEQQLASIAKEMLSSKYNRLEENIKGVLEKLEDAKHSQEISIAKKNENKEEIEFFKNFIDISSKKPYLKGQNIFEQVYDLDKDEALSLLVKNMHPLLKTIDHISPQKEDKDNKDSDINLVEACYFCNHDLKKGSSFGEFYTMYPSIKDNMPREKFEYAVSDLLSSSQNVIEQRLSASNILKLLEELFLQKKETENQLQSVNYRISSVSKGINEAIQSCEEEINEKEHKKEELETQYNELKKDPEYTAEVKRVQLTSQLVSIEDIAASLKTKRQRTSIAINEINNSKQQKKNQFEITDKEKEEKLTKLKDTLFLLDEQIKQQEESKADIELKLLELNEEFPSIDMITAKKMRAEKIYEAHLSLNQIKSEIIKNVKQADTLTEKENNLKTQISEISEDDVSFNSESYSKEQQEVFLIYKNLQEALAYIAEHPNGGSIKIMINKMAKQQINSEINKLENEDIIIEYNKFQKRKELKSELEKIIKEKAAIKKTIEKQEKECISYNPIVSEMTAEETLEQIDICSNKIKSLREKQLYSKIPQKINKLKAEMTLLQQTINDLKTKQTQIN